MRPMAKWTMRSACRAGRRGGDARGCVRAARRARGEFASRFVKPGEPIGHVRRPERRRRRRRRCRTTCGRFARCSRRPRRRTAFCRRSSPAIPSWRERCSCSRCTRAPRTIALSRRPIGRRACSITPTGTFSGPSSSSPATPSSYDGMARLWRDWGMPDLALSDVLPRAALQQEVGGDLQHARARSSSRSASSAGAERAYRTRGGAQPTRDICAEQPLLPPDDAGQRRRPRRVL